MVGAIAAGRDIDGRILYVQVAVPAVECAFLVIIAVEVSIWVRVYRLAVRANFIHIHAAAVNVEIFNPGELR